MSGRISDIEMKDCECSEKQNDDGLVNLKIDDCCGLTYSKVNEENGDSDLRRCHVDELGHFQLGFVIRILI